MMDWLYDELDPSSSARVAEHVEACPRCSAEIGAMRRTRAAFRELSELDPPPAISAILVHEAARHAGGGQAAASSDGFWSRLASWLRFPALHPAATALASLILVAGVAGALYVRRGWDIGRPIAVPEPAASESGAPAGPPKRELPAAAPADTAPEQEQSVDRERRDAEQDKAPSRTQAEDEPEPKSSTRAYRGDGVTAELLDGEKQADLRKAQQAKKSAKAKVAAGSSEPAADAVGADDDADEENRVARRGLGPAKPADVVESGGAESAPATPSQPQPRPESTSQVGAAGGEGSSAQGASPAQRPLSKKEQGWLEVQEQKLTALARSKRCREAASIANDIFDRNPDYYNRRVRDSKEIELCRNDVGSEQRRRAVRRAKAPPAAGKNSGAGQGQKSRAAPAKDESADKSAR